MTWMEREIHTRALHWRHLRSVTVRPLPMVLTDVSDFRFGDMQLTRANQSCYERFILLVI
jgi:hypothetical protein